MMRHPISTSQKALLPLLAITLVAGLSLSGCSLTQTVTLENVETIAPVASPPVHVTYNTHPNQFVFTPHLSLPSKRNVTGIIQVADVNNDSQQMSDTASLNWTIPAASSGINMDYIFSSHGAVAFGVSLSGINGLTYGGWSAGFGFFNEKENGAFRFDIGLQSTPVTYRATSRIITKVNNDPADTVMSYDKGVDNYLNFYGALTMNMTRKTWPANLFLNAYLTKQRFADFTPHASVSPHNNIGAEEVTASHWIVGVTPGVFITLMDDLRLVVGERIIFPFDIVDQSPYPLLQFHMQLDFSI